MSFQAVSTDSSTAIPIQPWMLRTEAGDAELLARIARGDFDAFQTFHDRYAARVAAFARQLCRDRCHHHQDEDVTQEVFTSVWTRAASFNPARGDAAGWLYTLTRNKLIDLWRRSSKGGQSEEIDDRRLGSRREENDLRLTLRQALSHVTPDQRQAIEMAYFDGLTYQETAQELDLPEGTLKSRIRLGLRTMRTVLTQGRRAAN
jgi:RNA polymerase sigma-70 factor (ECF subfamily)